MSEQQQAAETAAMGAVELTEAAREKLRQMVHAIERLEEEKREIAGHVKDKYGEAKSMGYDTKALRALIRLRRIDRQAREEADAVLTTYMIATGDA